MILNKLAQENNQKKGQLLLAFLQCITFCCIYYQISISPTFKSNQFIGLQTYNFCMTLILGIQSSVFADDMLVLPINGTFQLVQNMISMQIGVFTNFLQGYIIQVVTRVIVRQYVLPNKVWLQIKITALKKRFGLKSAQQQKFSLSTSKRILQEQLFNLGAVSMDFLSQFIFPVLMIFQMYFYR